MNASLKDYVHSGENEAFQSNVDELFDQRLAFLIEEADKIQKENEISSPMSDMDAIQFIREHRDKLPQPVLEKIGQFQSESKPATKRSSRTPTQQDETKSGSETPEVVIPVTKRERPKRKVSKK